MRETGLPASLFITEGMFTVVLYKTMDKTVEMILNEISDNLKITIKDLVE